MTVQEFSYMIKNDDNYYFTNPDDLLAEFQHYVYDKILPHIPEIFKNIPKAELKFVLFQKLPF